MKRGLVLLPMLLASCTGSLVEGGGLGAGPLGRFGHTLTGQPAAPAPVPAASTSQVTPSPLLPASPAPSPTTTATTSPSPAPTPSPTATPSPSPTPVPSLAPTASPAPTPYAGPYVTTMHDDWGRGLPTLLPGLFGLAQDRAGGVYLADQSHQIRRLVLEGNGYRLLVVAGGTEPGWVDASGTDARFNWPHGLAIDGAGYLYVADSGNHRLRRIDSGGRVLTLAGGPAGYANGLGSTARFNYPSGVAVDGNGTLYVADSFNHAIRTVGRTGEVATLAGGGVTGYADAAGDQARFATPIGVAVAGDRHVFVADSENHCIRQITPAGVVTTLAGNGTAGRADGLGSAARFDAPRGIALEASGSLLVADANNHQIRRVFRSGLVVTIMGSGRAGTQNARDPLEADFSLPSGVATAPSGKVWIADTATDRVRLYEPGTTR